MKATVVVSTTSGTWWSVEYFVTLPATPEMVIVALAVSMRMVPCSMYSGPSRGSANVLKWPTPTREWLEPWSAEWCLQPCVPAFQLWLKDKAFDETAVPGVGARPSWRFSATGSK